MPFFSRYISPEKIYFKLPTGYECFHTECHAAKERLLIKTKCDIKLIWRLNINMKSSLCVYLSGKHESWHIYFYFYPYFLFKASIKSEFGLSSIFFINFCLLSELDI